MKIVLKPQTHAENTEITLRGSVTTCRGDLAESRCFDKCRYVGAPT